jgi:hypothetical protein
MSVRRKSNSSCTTVSARAVTYSCALLTLLHFALAMCHSDATKDVTFECYNANTAKPLSDVGLSNILKQTSSASDSSSSSAASRARRGNTWTEIFRGLQSDTA